MKATENINYWKNRVTELTFQVETLKKDQTRLEFMAETGWSVLKTKNGYRVTNHGVTLVYPEKPNWRDAIDEAMEDEQ